MFGNIFLDQNSFMEHKPTSQTFLFPLFHSNFRFIQVLFHYFQWLIVSFLFPFHSLVGMNRNDGTARFAASVPDTITSWIISAFAMDSITGFGISPVPAKVNGESIAKSFLSRKVVVFQ